MRITDTSDLWWKSAIIYCLDIETFLDSNADGIGDLGGLATKIDYLAELGVNCLWLMPFYPSPDRDDGYDIVDFYGIDPRLGNHGELVEVVRTAHDRGLRVVADLIVNHTSEQHPWFKASRRSVDNPYRDYYVWRDTEPGRHVGRGGLPGRGGQHLGPGRANRTVVPAPLLLLPARPEPCEPQGDGRVAAHHRVLGSNWGSTASGWTPCPSSCRAPRSHPGRRRSSTSMRC